jgi:predicted ABC-type ATPase
VSTPVLHVVAGPNGAGKSTFVHRALQRVTRLPFVNADVIAAERWPGQEAEHAYAASAAAMAARADLLDQRRSFITETVFSHPSKLDLIRHGVDAGYLVTLHVVLLPLEVTLERVAYRIVQGGHAVPPDKVRARYARLWPLVADARAVAGRTIFYDNSRAANPFATVARYDRGQPVGDVHWPRWTPAALV